MTAIEKRLSRASARYRQTPRIDVIRLFGRPGAVPTWPRPGVVPYGPAAAHTRSPMEQTSRTPEGVPHPGTRLEDPGRLAVSLWLRLLESHNLILREVRRGMGGAATLPQFDVLAQLDREPSGLTLSALSRRLLVSAGNLTGIVARLERGGLVHRDGDPHDGRVFRVRLTGRGRALLAGLLPRHAAIVRELFAELPPREQDELRVRLARLRDAVVLQAARARHARGPGRSV